MGEGVGALPDDGRGEDLVPDEVVCDEGDKDAGQPHCPVRYCRPQSCLAAGVHVVREDVAEVEGQLGHQEVEAPVVTEVSHDNRPERERRPDASPWHGERHEVGGGQLCLDVVPLRRGDEGVAGGGVGGQQQPEQQPHQAGPALDVEDALPAPPVLVTHQSHEVMLETTRA